MIDLRGDSRDADTKRNAIVSTAPEAVIRLKAEALVRDSCHRHRLTVESNILGNLDVLEPSRPQLDLWGVVIVTTNECVTKSHSIYMSPRV